MSAPLALIVILNADSFLWSSERKVCVFRPEPEAFVRQAGATLGATEAFARAVELERTGNHPAALALLWQAAGLAPKDPDIHNRLGEALERIGALDAAVDAFRTAAASRPGFQKAENNLILALVKAGRGPEAVERARALADQSPRDPDAIFRLGLAQSEQDVSQAIRTFRRVLDMAPDHVLARYNLALVLKRMDRTDEAIKELTSAIRIEARAEAHYALGVIQWQRGELDAAAQSLRAAISIQPTYAEAHSTLGVVLQARGDSKGAVEALRRAIAIRPTLWSAHYTLGRVLQQNGDADAAREQLASADRLRRQAQVEHEASVATSVGTRRLDSGDAAGALEQFRRAVQIFDAYAPAHYQMGRALLALGDRGAARNAFHRAQQLNPSLVPPAR